MKNLKKIIVAASLCAAIGATAIAGTLAYFTDTKEAVNTFTVGDLGIVLDEPNWVEQNALDVVPGRTVAKDPGVTIEAGSVASYVRVVVTMPKVVYEYSNFYHENAEALVLFQNQSKYVTVNEAASDFESDTVKIVLDYGMMSATTEATDLGDIFTDVTFSEKITNAEAALIGSDEWNIGITAYATQAEGFEIAGADAAFKAAFPTVFGE